MEHESVQGGCARWLLGCGAAALLAVLVLIGIGLGAAAPFRRAAELREQAEAGPGGLERFTPSAEGTVPPERVRAFLAVRGALSASCAEVTEAALQLDRMESFDGRDEVPRGELLRQAWATTRTAIGLGPAIGRFFETRNRALLERGMGLGEYALLYLAAYHDRLSSQPREGGLARELSPRSEVLSGFPALLERWRAAAADPALAAALDRELEALAADRRRLPWAGGLPAPLAGSLAPFREELDALFCAEAVGLELGVNRERLGGLTIETR